ncbi:MAG TPA: ribonuclease III, partial [Candidatus Magasanikbacteria bacterium]|nr:ribonuclease III [Candidatus Magasanikbacteria bacterium]
WNLPHNERLEFLGDAVLELVITDYLFSTYKQYEEGRLTSIRAALVNYQALSKVAKSLGIEEFIIMSKGEARDTGKARDVILANACEALIGAIYLDKGYDVAKDFILKNVLVDVDEIVQKNLDKDSKSLFQEIAQEKFKITPSYKVLDEYGPDHKKIFVVGVFLNENKIADGSGLSKQEAELDAAKKAIHVLKTS